MSRTPTESADHITIEDIDTELSALGGDDTVIAIASGAIVHGDDGDDWLTANLYGAASEDEAGDGEADIVPTLPLEVELYGDDGDDHLHAVMRGYDWEGPSITAKLHGGDGDDILWIDLVASSGVLTSFVDGGAGNDTIRVTALTDDTRYGAGGPIEINAGSGDDDIVVYADGGGSEFTSGGAISTIYAGEGNDRIEIFQTSWVWDVGGSTNNIYGGNGDDEIIATAAGGADWGNTDNHIWGGDGNDDITSTAIAQGGVSATTFNEVFGGDGDDRMILIGEAYPDSSIEGVDGTNQASGGSGDDTITARLSLTGYEHGNHGINQIYGDAGNDRLTAIIEIPRDEIDSARSELFGGAGDDRLKATGGNDNFLWGNLDDDTLLGSANDDHLIGGQGADYLKGYGGEDTFVFMGARGLSAAERDRVADFTIGDDLIDVHSIDAKSWRSGNQAFTFDADGTGKSGTIWVEDNPDTNGSIVYANTGKAMLAITLLDGRGVDAHDYSASDFIL